MSSCSAPKSLLAAALLALVSACATTAPAAAKPRAEPIAQLPDEGLLGPAHAAHQNQLVFSLKPIARQNAPEAALTQKAHVLSPIFARLFLGTSPWNLASSRGLKCPEEPDLDYQLVFRIVSVNGAAAGDLLVSKPITENLFKSSTSFSIADGADDALNDAKVVFPRDAWGDAMSNPKAVDYHFAAQLVPRLREGSNQVNFSAFATCGRLGSEVEIAIGQLELEVKPGDKERFWAAHGPVVKPFPAKEFAKLEPTGRQVYRDRFGGDPVRMFAVSDWGYPQNVSGVITRRQVSVAAVEQKDGACRIVQFGLEQGASGPHRFEGEVHLTSESPGGPQPFPCTVASAR